MDILEMNYEQATSFYTHFDYDFTSSYVFILETTMASNCLRIKNFLITKPSSDSEPIEIAL